MKSSLFAPLAVLAASFTAAAPLRAAELTPEALAGFDHYVERTEKRIDDELSSREGFLAIDFLPEQERSEARTVLESGDVFTAKLRTVDSDGSPIEIRGGMVHHWVGAVLVPRRRVADVVRFLQRYDDHARYFTEVERSRLVARRGDEFDVFLRLRRKKIVTVTYDTDHHVRYRRFGDGRVASESHSTRIAEVDDAGSPREREKPIGDDRGFLWRLDSYWRFEQVPEGVVVECESVSLSRGIPAALRWIVGGYLDSVPRESLESTLRPIQISVPSLSTGTVP